MAILIYKGLNLPFETRSLAVDAILLICFFSVDLIRISTAQSGNKTGEFYNWFFKLSEKLTELVEMTVVLALRGPVGVSIAFTLPTIMLALYFYLWQTYVLSIEQTLIGTDLNIRQNWKWPCIRTICSTKSKPKLSATPDDS